MQLKDAFRAAIKSYWKGDDYEMSATFKDKKYNKKYFDNVKSEMAGGKSDKKTDKEKMKEKESY